MYLDLFLEPILKRAALSSTISYSISVGSISVHSILVCFGLRLSTCETIFYKVGCFFCNVDEIAVVDDDHSEEGYSSGPLPPFLDRREQLARNSRSTEKYHFSQSFDIALSADGVD